MLSPEMLYGRQSPGESSTRQAPAGDDMHIRTGASGTSIAAVSRRLPRRLGGDLAVA